jgi:hypothetical protein
VTIAAISSAPGIGRRQPLLRALLLVVMVLPLVAATVVSSPVPFETRVEAAFLWMLCLVPAWMHLSAVPMNRRPIPFIPMIGILYGLYYALGAALGAYNQHYKIFLNPGRDYDDAVFVALYGWLALGLGYLGARLLASPKASAHPIEIADAVRRRYGALLMVGGILLESYRLVRQVPVEIAGILKFISTLGWFGCGLLVTMLTQRRLNVAYRLLTYAGVAAFLLMAVGSGSVANAAFFGAVVFVSAWIGLGRIRLSWIAGAALGIALIISLRGVSEQYRKVVWIGGDGGGVVSRTKLFFRLLHARVQSDGIDGAVSKGFETSAGRSANLDLLADVIIRTPREIPYWGGQTYLSLVGSFVPRVIWANKPTKELGQAFGHRYGYIGNSDTNTALNLPILVEFYANFGIAGVIAGMFLVGMIYFLLDRSVNNPGQDSLHSLVGVVILIPMANIESDFSLGFGGLILNGVALWFVLRTIRRSGMANNRAGPPLGGRLQPFASHPRTS